MHILNAASAIESTEALKNSCIHKQCHEHKDKLLPGTLSGNLLPQNGLPEVKEVHTFKLPLHLPAPLAF